MMQITITDEQTRLILQRAAWTAATAEIGNFGEDCWAGSEEPEDDYLGCRRDAAERIEAFVTLSAMADRIGASELGDVVEIPEVLSGGVHDAWNTSTSAVADPTVWSEGYQARLVWLQPAAERLANAFGLAEVTA